MEKLGEGSSLQGGPVPGASEADKSLSKEVGLKALKDVDEDPAAQAVSTDKAPTGIVGSGALLNKTLGDKNLDASATGTGALLTSVAAETIGLTEASLLLGVAAAGVDRCLGAESKIPLDELAKKKEQMLAFAERKAGSDTRFIERSKATTNDSPIKSTYSGAERSGDDHVVTLKNRVIQLPDGTTKEEKIFTIFEIENKKVKGSCASVSRLTPIQQIRWEDDVEVAGLDGDKIKTNEKVIRQTRDRTRYMAKEEQKDALEFLDNQLVDLKKGGKVKKVKEVQGLPKRTKFTDGEIAIQKAFRTDLHDFKIRNMDQALDLLTQTSNGCAYLHTKSDGKPAAVHGDLKPENMMEDDGKYVIIDFGDSKTAEEIVAGMKTKGTPLYINSYDLQLKQALTTTKEQKAEIAFGQDVYAAGLSYLEILAKKNIFENPKLLEVERSQNQTTSLKRPITVDDLKQEITFGNEALAKELVEVLNQMTDNYVYARPTMEEVNAKFCELQQKYRSK